jgi:hypothetical protein
MADKRVFAPKFSGHKDDFCIWLVRAEAYAEWFDFVKAMQPVAEANLPVNELDKSGTAGISNKKQEGSRVPYGSHAQISSGEQAKAIPTGPTEPRLT